MAYLSPGANGYQSPVAELRCGFGSGPASIGNCRRWGVREVERYLYASLPGEPRQPLFSSFLLTPVRMGSGRFIEPLYIGFAAPAEAADWLEWLVELFSPDLYLRALDQAIGEEERRKRKIDIWITLPYPDPLQERFGTVGGKPLNFRNGQDRQTALRWWIGLFLRKWREAGFRGKLRLRGFRWPRESIVKSEGEDTLIRAVSDDLHREGLEIMWLTNYGAAYVAEWKELGFDVTLLHPGYYGLTDTQPDYIDYAAYFSQTLQCGLQLVCGKGPLFDSRHMYEYFFRGLPGRRNYLAKAFLLFQFQGTDLPDLARTRKALYRDIALLVTGIRKRNIGGFLEASRPIARSLGKGLSEK